MADSLGPVKIERLAGQPSSSPLDTVEQQAIHGVEMSRVIFPNSSRAIPKTNAERIAERRDTNVEEGKPEGLYSHEDTMQANLTHQANTAPRPKQATGIFEQHDEPFHEMTKDARVWNIYVEESDRLDKEMVDGRNNSLDVLLIFAALFSAISTSFIIVSLADLRPDAAQSSAQTLLMISQTLNAMANGQQAPAMAQGLVAEPFSPPGAAVLVNVLWLLSLSLSVVVSLIAMLAKDWCHHFMSGRYGQIYDQARLRQQKWNGIERWKMEHLLSYLPGIMHLAVLLFAIGLCIYLWGVNTRVAAPVTVVTMFGLFVYASTTVLPVLDQHCPYGTPATAPIAFIIRTSKRYLGALLKQTRCIAGSRIEKIHGLIQKPRWLNRGLKRIAELVQPPNIDYESDYKNSEDFVHMDEVTSQMLAWMIKYCEDSRTVDVALQAIAGARPELPHTQLIQCRALDLVYDRLKACVRLNQSSGQYQVRDASMLPAALSYIRAYGVLMTQGLNFIPSVGWKMHYPGSGGNSDRIGHEMNLEAKNVHEAVLNNKTNLRVEPSVLAAAEMVPIRFYGSEAPGSSALPPATKPQKLIITLHQHVTGEGAPLSVPKLLALVEYSFYYLISGWPTENKRQESLLPAILIHMFLISYDTAPEVACTVASTLAATVFAVESHHGGEAPSQEAEGRQKRAVQMLQYYRANKPNEQMVDRLFVFGFLGLLPFVNLHLEGIQDAALPQRFADIVAWASTEGFEYDIFGLPTVSSCHLHCNFAVSKCLLRVAFDLEEEPAVVLSMNTVLRARFLERWDKSRIYLPALIALRHAKSRALQNICIQLLESKCLTFAVQAGLELMNDDEILRVMIENEGGVDPDILPQFLFYFRRFISSIMLSTYTPLVERRAALRRLLNHRAFEGDVFSTETQTQLDGAWIINHAAENTRDLSELDGIRGTMQLVTHFCHANVFMGHEHPQSRQGLQQDENFLQTEWFEMLLSVENPFAVNHQEGGSGGPNVNLS